MAVRTWRWVPLVAVLALLGGCGAGAVPGNAQVDEQTGADRQRVLEYLDASNTAAAEGATAQTAFFGETQHPDFPADGAEYSDCLDPVEQDLTVTVEPTVSTIRLDPGWAFPDSDGEVPAGRVYVLAATLTLEQGGNEVAGYVATQHVVILDDGSTVAFAPCFPA